MEELVLGTSAKFQAQEVGLCTLKKEKMENLMTSKLPTMAILPNRPLLDNQP